MTGDVRSANHPFQIQGSSCSAMLSEPHRPRLFGPLDKSLPHQIGHSLLGPEIHWGRPREAVHMLIERWLLLGKVTGRAGEASWETDAVLKWPRLEVTSEDQGRIARSWRNEGEKPRKSES
jgi:hypothetical protein